MRIGAAIAACLLCCLLAQTASAEAAHSKGIPRPHKSPRRGGPGSSYRAALDWAERLYSESVPFPDGDYGMDDVLDAIRQVERRFPWSIRASIDKGRCYMACGHYRDAADTFWQIRSHAASLFKESTLRAKLSSELASRLPGKFCLQIERIPGRRAAWVALLYTSLHDDAFFRPLIDHPILQFFTASKDRPLRLTAVAPVHQYVDDGARTATLGVKSLGESQGYGALVYQTFTGGDSLPNSQDVFRFASRRVVHVGEFTGIENARVFPASKRHGLRLKVFATWKVGWPDVYEWRNGAFRFANRMNPDLYQSDLGPYTSPEDYYPTWMDRAALADISGNFDRGAKFWRRAEALCRIAVRSGSKWTFHGYSNRGNLAEIRRRLTWLRRKAYNHWLLYRPYDADLFVPPYRLGNAFNRDY